MTLLISLLLVIHRSWLNCHNYLFQPPCHHASCATLIYSHGHSVRESVSTCSPCGGVLTIVKRPLILHTGGHWFKSSIAHHPKPPHTRHALTDTPLRYTTLRHSLHHRWGASRGAANRKMVPDEIGLDRKEARRPHLTIYDSAANLSPTSSPRIRI